MGTGLNRLIEAVLTSTRDLCFRAKNKKIMYTHVNPRFAVQYIKVGCVSCNLRGYKLHGHVILMSCAVTVTMQLICAFVFTYAKKKVFFNLMTRLIKKHVIKS